MQLLGSISPIHQPNNAFNAYSQGKAILQLILVDVRKKLSKAVLSEAVSAFVP